MVHEASLHERNCFVTLTYNDQELPEHGSLYKPHLQRFFKRLRKLKGPFRYYACGEYGDRTDRAHYHACIFGLDFHDKIHFRKIGEHNLYLSDELEKIWGHGNTSIGSLTFETAAYTARYVTKKLSKGQARYVRLDTDTGEIIPLVQPFAVMSLRCRAEDGRVGGIASEWIRRHHGDIYNPKKDFVVMRGKKLPSPKYYDKIYDTIDATRLKQIKEKRQEEAKRESYTELRARASITRARVISKTQI